MIRNVAASLVPPRSNVLRHACFHHQHLLSRRDAGVAIRATGNGVSCASRGKFTLGKKADDGVPLREGTLVHRLHQAARSRVDQGLIFHIGKLVSLSSIFATDWLVLRLAMVSGSLCSVVFHFLFPDPRPMRMFYGVLFAVGHLTALMFYLYSKTDVFWSIDNPQDVEIYEKFFKPFGMSKWEYLQVRKCSTLREAKAGEVMARQGDEMPVMWLVISGQLHSTRVWSDADAAVIGADTWEKFRRHCANFSRPTTQLTYGKGIWMGEIYDKNYDWDAPHHWRVSAIVDEDSLLLEVRRREFWDFVSTNPHVQRIADAMQLKDLWNSRRHTALTTLSTIVRYETELDALRTRVAELEARASSATTHTV